MSQIKLQTTTGYGLQQSKSANSFCDPKQGKFLGRTFKSWCKILLFYLTYYAFLAVLFFSALSWSKSRINKDTPLIRSRLDQPGMSVIPMNDYIEDNDNSEFPLIGPTGKGIGDTYQKEMTKFLAKYSECSNEELEELNIAEFFDLSNDTKPYKINELVFQTLTIDKEIIIFLQVNRIINWKPIAYDPLELLAYDKDFGIDQNLRNYLTKNINPYQSSKDNPNRIYFNCFNYNTRAMKYGAVEDMYSIIPEKPYVNYVNFESQFVNKQKGVKTTACSSKPLAKFRIKFNKNHKEIVSEKSKSDILIRCNTMAKNVEYNVLNDSKFKTSIFPNGNGYTTFGFVGIRKYLNMEFRIINMTVGKHSQSNNSLSSDNKESDSIVDQIIEVDLTTANVSETILEGNTMTDEMTDKVTVKPTNFVIVDKITNINPVETKVVIKTEPETVVKNNITDDNINNADKNQMVIQQDTKNKIQENTTDTDVETIRDPNVDVNSNIIETLEDDSPSENTTISDDKLNNKIKEQDSVPLNPSNSIVDVDIYNDEEINSTTETVTSPPKSENLSLDNYSNSTENVLIINITDVTTNSEEPQPSNTDNEQVETTTTLAPIKESPDNIINLKTEILLSTPNPENQTQNEYSENTKNIDVSIINTANVITDGQQVQSNNTDNEQVETKTTLEPIKETTANIIEETFTNANDEIEPLNKTISDSDTKNGDTDPNLFPVKESINSDDDVKDESFEEIKVDEEQNNTNNYLPQALKSSSGNVEEPTDKVLIKKSTLTNMYNLLGSILSIANDSLKGISKD